MKQSIRKGFLIGIICWFTFGLIAQPASIIFRMDDIELQEDSLLEGILTVFQQHGIPLSLGVIPFAQNNEPRAYASKEFRIKIQEAEALGQLEILLHGFSHSHNGLTQQKSEFAGLGLAEQKTFIASGRKYLTDSFQVPVRFFVPPWNTYDLYTLHALKELGFEGLSADLGGVSIANVLAYIPTTVIDFKDWDQVLQQSKTKQGVTVVLFHSYTFTKGGFSLLDLDTLLAQTVANGNKCYTFSSYTKQAISFPGSFRYQLNAKMRYSPIFFFLSNRSQQWVFLEDFNVLYSLLTIGVLFVLLAIYLGLRIRRNGGIRKYFMGR